MYSSRSRTCPTWVVQRNSSWSNSRRVPASPAASALARAAAGHSLVLDWNRGHDVSFDDHRAQPVVFAQLAEQDLDAVLTADAVLFDVP